MTPNLYLPPGYRRNVENVAFVDMPSSLNYQPHVYALASRLVRLSGARAVVDLGCGSGEKLAVLPHGTRVWVVDLHPNEAALREQLPHLDLCVQRCDLERGLPDIPTQDLADSVVICGDVVEHLRDPLRFLRALSHIAAQCRYLLISTPARDRARGPADIGPPANPAHCQEWTLAEFVLLARSAGLNVPLHGYTWNTDHHGWKTTILAIDGREANVAASADDGAAASDICAIVKAFNDEDFIEHCVINLRRQGLQVHVIDNWSTDRTYPIAEALAAADAGVTVERFPERAVDEYVWRALLERTVQVAERRGPGWYLHVDSDEVRESPWQGVMLADAIRHVDRCGYNAIDFTVIDFRYLRDEPVGDAPWESMRFFEFGRRPGHFQQIKGWKYTGPAVDLASSGGHEAQFADRRVFPLKFLLRHYPLRGREHARRKVFHERLPRTQTERLQYGWHTQYLGISEERLAGWHRHELLPWHPVTFQTDWLVERLSGIGLLD